jgi:succinyl-diaminopimelate desuccinylase
MSALDLSKHLVELTIDVCNIESVSGSEKSLADAIEQALQLPHLSVIRDGNAVVATTRNDGDGVIIAGHIDTVPIANNLPARLHHFERELVIFGRGSVDMKGGVAVMLKLASEITKPSFRVSWIFYDNEEVDSAKNGLGRLTGNHPVIASAKFAILCEPTSALIEAGCNGTLRVKVSTRGVKSHSARPWMGENAIHKAAPILERLAGYQCQTIEVDGLEYRESLNAVSIRAGIIGNIIPDLCEVEVNYRFAPSRGASEAVAVIGELFPEFELEFVDLAMGARPGLQTQLAKAFLQSAGAEPRPKYGWTDVARFSALGIPALNYGPGDPSLAHADNENLPVGHLFEVEKCLRGWLSS